MKILVAGANGNTGKRIVRILREQDHDVRAMIRCQAQATALGMVNTERKIVELLAGDTPIRTALEAI